MFRKERFFPLLEGRTTGAVRGCCISPARTRRGQEAGKRKNVLGWRHKKGLYTGRGLETCHERALLLCGGSGTAGEMLRPRRSQTVPKGWGSGPARRIHGGDGHAGLHQGGPAPLPLFYDQLFQQQGLFAGLSGQETHGAQTGHAAAFVGQLHQIGKKLLVLDPGSLALEQFV